MKQLDSEEISISHKLKIDFEFAGDRYSFVDLLNQQAFTLRMKEQDFKRAREFAFAAVEFSREIGYENGLAWGLINKARCRFHVDCSTEINKCVDESLAIFRDIGNRRGEANALLLKARILIQEREYVRANDFLEEGLRTGRMANDPQSEQLAYYFWAILCEKLKDPESTIKYCKFALSIKGEYGMRARCTVRIGKALLAMKRFGIAKNKFEEALIEAERSGDSFSKATIFVQLASIYAHEEDGEKAVQFLGKGLKIANLMGLFRKSDIFWNGLLELFAGIENPDIGLRMLEELEAISKKQQSAKQNLMVALMIAEAQLQKGNLEDARSLLESLEAQMEFDDAIPQVLAYHRLLSVLREIEGNIESSLTHLRISNELKEIANEIVQFEKLESLEIKARIENLQNLEKEFRERNLKSANVDNAEVSPNDLQSKQDSEEE